MPIMLYSQRDKRWADKKLGKSNQTIGRVGCTTTAVTTGLTAFGCKIDPTFLGLQNAYTPDGYVRWPDWKLPPGWKFK
jgi:hypothetical protein